MVESSLPKSLPNLDASFHALADATRRQMLRELSHGGRSVGQLAKPFAMSLAAASKHIKTLERAGLVRREVQGSTHMCHLEAGPLSAARDWLNYYEGFWSRRLDALEQALLAEDPPKPTPRKGKKK